MPLINDRAAPLLRSNYRNLIIASERPSLQPAAEGRRFKVIPFPPEEAHRPLTQHEQLIATWQRISDALSIFVLTALPLYFAAQFVRSALRHWGL
jgi:hypothetical protein